MAHIRQANDSIVALAHRGFRGTQTLGRSLRDLVYPPGCATCGLPVAKAGSLCSDCWCSVRFIERPYCEILGLPFGFDPGQARAWSAPKPLPILRFSTGCELPLCMMARHAIWSIG